MGHGSGGRLTADLVANVFLPALGNPILNRLADSAEVSVGTNRLVFTTDSFVVSPLRFPGGDIGSLAVHGTINDLAVMGGRPIGLSAAFILEEGVRLDDVRAIADSMGEAADHAGIRIIAADTKVVEHGKGDGVYITTSGIGLISANLRLGAKQIRAGDAVIVSGPIGDHGIAVLSAREGLTFQTELISDSAPLNSLVEAMLESGAVIRCMRDPTRGGVATTLNELSVVAGAEIEIEEQALPVRDSVRAACEILGLDPLYVACEGRLIAIVEDRDADRLLEIMHNFPEGAGACRIGRITSLGSARVLLRTLFGSARVINVLEGAQLPRIC
jgi:hydrogenase expression/formation protein HypE